MLEAFSVEQVRRAEAALRAELPDGTLMGRAAFGLAAACAGLLRRVYGARVVAVVGSGDNGGDALYAAALLARRGALVEAVLLSPERAHEGGLDAIRRVGGLVRAAGSVTAGEVACADLVLDGVTGIGGRGGLWEEAARLFSGVPLLVVAVDVPSGVDSGSGAVSGEAVRADATVTFGAYKPGALIDPGAGYAGECRFVDIGLRPYLYGEPEVEALEADDVEALLPRPDREMDKYRRGVVGITAGSAKYPGAAVLAVGAALRSGIGAVRFVGDPAVTDGVLARHPEVMVAEGGPAQAGRVQAWVVGPGLGTSLMAAERLREVLAQDVPVLVDADGLTLLKQYGADWLTARTAPTALTPHAGEAARLLGWDRERIESHRLAAVRELADRFGVTALLKGSTTLVAEPGRSTVRVNTTGVPALATAGSGDVLAGLAGGLLAAGLSAFDALSAAAWLHGTAAQAACGASGSAIVASDVVTFLGG